MISGDGWSQCLPDICLTVEEKLWKKPQPGKLTRLGIEPGPAWWETRMSCNLFSLLYKGYIKSNGNSLIFLTWLHRGTTFMYLQCSRHLIYHLLPNVWKASYTISASIFVDVPYWPPYSTDKFISCVIPGPSHSFFHFGEEILISWPQEKIMTFGGTESHSRSGVQSPAG